MESEGRDVVARAVPTFYFVGVTTGQSWATKMFPLWMRELGRPEVVMEGVDLRIHDDREAYRRVVAQVKFDDNSIGALVTTHKIDLLDAARDLFDYLDPSATALGEVSSISKGQAGLEGHAFDPITAGLSLDRMLGSGYFEQTGGDVLCFGAGGSGAAIALNFVGKPVRDRPRRFVAVNRSQPRLDRLRELIERQGTQIEFEYVCNEEGSRNDELLRGMPAGSLIVNATGMGKDRPGSPISAAAVFPESAVAWELNYRGDLLFKRQALGQSADRHVRVEDGWDYFVHGWAWVVAQVLHIDLTPDLFERLAVLAKQAA